MRSLLLLLFVGMFVVSFGQDKVTKITVTIEPYKYTTNGAFHAFLALTCSNRGVDYINGFDFEWGYTYKLKLKQTKLAQPMQDAGDTDYDLIKVISKEAVADSTTFKIGLTGWVHLSHNSEKDPGAFVFKTNRTCTYLDGMVFSYTDEFEEELRKLNKTDGYKKGTFMFLKGEIFLISM